MKTIVVGAGFTGVQLARALIVDGHRVTLIDRDPDRVRDIGNLLDCEVVRAQGNNLDALEKAGVESADALVAVTDSDEVNMITCALVDAAYPHVKKIARVRNYSYYAVTEDAARKYAEKFSGDRRPPFGIDWMVNPDVEVAKSISRSIAHGAVGGVLEVGMGVGIVSIVVGAGSCLNEMPLRNLATAHWWRHLVVYVERAGGAELAGGETVLHAGDRIGVLAKLSEISVVAKICDAKIGSTSRLLLVGAGDVASHVLAGVREKSDGSLMGRFLDVARAAKSFLTVSVVDDSIDRCRALTEDFRDVNVFCGEVTDVNLVREENLGQYDLALSVSDNYERNLITAAYLKTCGVTRAVALTANADVAGVAAKMGIDVVVPMRDTVVDSIISHLRGQNVKSVHTVCGGAFEIVECVVPQSCKAVGRKLRDLKLPGKALVLMIDGLNDGERAPNGDTVVPAGATVVLIVPSGDRRVIRIFAD